jgi:hypothetical protein
MRKRPKEPRPRTGTKRVLADVPEHVWREVRIRCLQRGVLMRDYVLELLAKDGIQ